MAESERNAFHGKLRGLITANQAVANEAKRIADAQDAGALDSTTITDLVLLFFNAVVLVFRCREDGTDGGITPTHAELDGEVKKAAERLDMDEEEVNILLDRLCQLVIRLSGTNQQLSTLFRPAAKKKRS